MAVSNRGIVIIMTNPQKKGFSNKEVMYICKKKQKKTKKKTFISSGMNS